MNIQLKTTIDGNNVVCDLVPDTDVSDATWCFSLMSVGQVIEGGIQRNRVGGYLEVDLPPLRRNQSHRVVIKYVGDATYTTNRAWGPLGNFLKTSVGTVAFDAPRQGVMTTHPTDVSIPDELRIVPPVDAWRPSAGAAVVHQGFQPHPAIQGVVDLASRLGIAAFDAGGTPLSCDIDPTLAAEAYEVAIAPDHVSLRGGDAAGLHYAAITVLTLFMTYGGAIPNGHISDHPRFSWRGQHLDCARHGFETASILRLLDLMALFKLNKFHWHFADDEAFRIPLPSLPELARLQTRGIDHAVPSVFAAGPSAHRVYDQQDIQTLLAHAKSLHIDVLPEIEIPAHAYGLCKVFPQTRDPDDTGQETSVQGYTANILNPAMPETWRVIKAMISDIADLFPFAHIHLGCDELPTGAWQGSPRVSALMAEHDLKTTNDIQGWMMERVGAIAVEHGLRPAAWEEAQYGKNGGIGHDAILFSWTGQAPGIAAARAGYDIVMCPAQYTYFDMAHTRDPEDWGASWAACFGLSETVSWSPVPLDAPDIADRVLGVQGTYWGEFTAQDAQFEPMIAPRILGLAVTAWCSDQLRRDCDIHGLAAAYAPVFTALNWQWHKTA